MTTPKKTVAQRQRRRLVMTLVSVAVLVTVFGVVLFLFHSTETLKLTPDPVFDKQACVRLQKVSRVYRVALRTGRPHRVWLATAEGVRVFDRRTFEWTRYGLDHGLPSEIVADICFGDSRVWVATWDGVARFNDTTGQFIPVSAPSGLRGNRALAVAWQKETGLVFSLDGQGLFRCDSADGAARAWKLAGVPRDARITLLKEEKGILYIGVQGKRLYTFSKGKVQQVPFQRAHSPDTYIWDICHVGDSLWVATSDDGIWVTSPVKDTLVPYTDFPAKGAYCFAPAKDGLWCGTPFGLWRFHHKSKAWVQFVHPHEKSPTDFEVFTLAAAGERLWYGSMELGAGILNTRNIEWQPLRAGLSEANVAAMAEYDDRVWTGYGYQGGFVDRFTARGIQYDRNLGRSTGLTDDHIQTMYTYDSLLYVGGYAHFGFWDPRRFRFSCFDQTRGLPFGDITHITEGTHGTLVLSSQFGCIEYDPGSQRFMPVSITQPLRTTCALVRGDSLWVGTLARGVQLFDRRHGRHIKTFCEKAFRIVGIEEVTNGDGETVLFIGTKTSGSYIINSTRGGPAQQVSPEVDFSDVKPREREVFTMRRIDGRIWLGTRAAGCLVYDPVRRYAGRFTEYHGLVSDQVRSFWDTPRHVYIGSYGGLVRIEKTYVDSVWYSQLQKNRR